MSRVELTPHNLFNYTLHGHVDMMNYFLLHAPYLFGYKGFENRNIAHYAAASGVDTFFDIAVVQHFAHVPADNGYLPIMQAAQRGHYNVAVKLVALTGDNWLVRTKQGSTLLHLLAVHYCPGNVQHEQFALTLFQRGLGLNNKNHIGKTPLDYAKELNKNPAAINGLSKARKFYEETCGLMSAESDLSADQQARSQLPSWLTGPNIFTVLEQQRSSVHHSPKQTAFGYKTVKAI